MKNNKFIALAVLPFMLVGCGNNQNSGDKDGVDKATYAEKEVDFTTEEGWNEILPEVRKAVKATAPAVLANANLELVGKTPSFNFKTANAFVTETEENKNSSVELTVKDFELSLTGGAKKLSSAKTFNDLEAYLSASVKGSINAKQNEESILDLTFNDFAADAYLKSGILYGDISKVDAETLNKIVALANNSEEQNMTSLLIAQFLNYVTVIQEKGGKFSTNILGMMFASEFNAVTLPENFETTVDETLTYEYISQTLNENNAYLEFLNSALKVGSDKNHKLIFTVAGDAKEIYETSKDEVYNQYLEEVDDETPVSKEEFFAVTDEYFKDFRAASIDFSAKFDNNYVLSSLTLNLNLDITLVSENYDEDDQLLSTATTTIKGSESLGLYLDTTTDVSNKLPSGEELKAYEDLTTLLGAGLA